MDGEEPRQPLERLAACRTPYLIGVRHHSTALARAMPELLDSIRPKSILLEMPPDFQSWLPHLGDPELVAPVALAACNRSELNSFYPLADFSPELVAIRWATKNGVPIIPCDLDLAGMHAADHFIPNLDKHTDEAKVSPSLQDEVMRRHETRDFGELWEKLVETPALNSSPEAIRRAALYFGWLSRCTQGELTYADAHRELAMRTAIDDAPDHSVAIIGAFHAAALLPEPLLWSPPEPFAKELVQYRSSYEASTSLIPYTFAQLDARSGYPAGVYDPIWHQTMLKASDNNSTTTLISDLAVRLSRQLRHAGYVAGSPEAMEIVRVALDLSRLRGHAAPGRAEFLESIETTLVQGDLLGRGRAVAAAAQHVLVGTLRGKLAPGTPRSGLAPHVEEKLSRLKLPGPDTLEQDTRELRLDPLRSQLDRARAVLFRRLNLLGVPYATRTDTTGVGLRENLTEVWQVRWTHGTAATVEAAAIYGVTLVQAAESALRKIGNDQEPDSDGRLHPAVTLKRLLTAAECGLPTSASQYLEQLDGHFLHTASTPELIEAAGLVGRVAAGHFSGLPLTNEDAAPPDVYRLEVPLGLLNSIPFLEMAIRSADGLRGSDDPNDVISLTELVALVRATSNQQTSHLAMISLIPALRSLLLRIRKEGSARMQGAAWGGLATMGDADVVQLSQSLSSWYDAASNHDGRQHLRARLQGLLVPLAPLVAAETSWLDGIQERLTSSDDSDFLARLPALRGGFQSISPNERARILCELIETLEPDGPGSSRRIMLENPIALAAASSADRAGREAVRHLLPNFVIREPGKSDAYSHPISISDPPGEISLTDRWRLVLGVQGSRGAKSRRVASTLDELYGGSARPGRGHRDDLVPPSRGGTESATPSAREWLDDVMGLFGKDLCEEIAAEAAADGRPALLEYLDGDKVRPSVALLEQVLSLKGGMPERELSLLRRLARKITERLAQQLANRLRPALNGLSSPRSTRRKHRKVDFPRTIRDNLATAYRRENGSVALAPRRMSFKAPSRKQMDWHLIFVVDVSGSMEPSVIYSALMGAIFSALPAIDVRFFAFSTEVIDFSDQVDDPLSLLMEVQVGGGTHVGLGLRAAREAVRNPTRTIVVLVSDFEEGVSIGQMLGEARTLAESGVKLLGLAALDDEANPRYHVGNAAALAGAGMSVAAVTPERLAQWVGDQIRGATT
ncbi:VWA domain-containing protein [Bremerella cremea]|uniref:VWA containing CoxE family protein n=1 Tax=Blastopirellula marina TaxID=124 RepID=A0A2S8G808_9BACT|nr:MULTISPECIES: DUF5682 family protein [Pirellulaceae]PQO40595.1 VWA containing CoxE family protein [Blastopirellula marina]RCS52177.1 VWA domain-containing protein [Bremerella cremea]